ncbi:MAD2 mitotic arrest deficient-like 2 [Chamberlinius hualienensis]
MEIIVDVLSEFLEVVINNVLYIRRIYPQGIFVKKKKYGIPIQMSVHPELNNYLINCVKSMRSKLLANEVQAIAIAFLEESTSNIVQRFVIEIGDVKTAVKQCEHNLAAIEEVLRSFCVKIATCNVELKPLPPGCCFKLFIHTRSLNPVNTTVISDPTKEVVWIESDSTRARIMNPLVTPVKSTDNSILQMQLFVETYNQIQLG